MLSWLLPLLATISAVLSWIAWIHAVMRRAIHEERQRAMVQLYLTAFREHQEDRLNEALAILARRIDALEDRLAEREDKPPAEPEPEAQAGD